MKTFAATIVAAAFVLVALLPAGDAGAQQCSASAKSASANCYRQAGATCDAKSKRWVNFDKARYDACIAGGRQKQQAPSPSYPPGA